MTESFKMGPGRLRLKIGADATKTFEQQMTNFRVEPSENVDTEDAIPTLDGGEIAAEDTVTYSATCNGNAVQDLSAAGFVNFTWDNAGAIAEFWFVPNNDVDRAVHGLTRLVPVTIGGDVKTRPRSDFTWSAGHPDSTNGDGDPAISGLPVFGDYDPVDNEVEEDV